MTDQAEGPQALTGNDVLPSIEKGWTRVVNGRPREILSEPDKQHREEAWILRESTVDTDGGQYAVAVLDLDYCKTHDSPRPLEDQWLSDQGITAGPYRVSRSGGRHLLALVDISSHPGGFTQRQSLGGQPVDLITATTLGKQPSGWLDMDKPLPVLGADFIKAHGLTERRGYGEFQPTDVDLDPEHQELAEQVAEQVTERWLSDFDPDAMGGRERRLFDASQKFLRLYTNHDWNADRAWQALAVFLEPILEQVDNSSSPAYWSASVDAFLADNRTGLPSTLADIISEGKPEEYRPTSLKTHDITDQLAARAQTESTKSAITKSEKPSKPKRKRPALPELRSVPIPDEEDILWQGDSSLITGHITFVYAPSKVGKTTMVFGHLLPPALNSGMKLVVFSKETTWRAALTYAVEHGFSYESSDLIVLNPDTPPTKSDYWSEVWEYIMWPDNLNDRIRAVLEYTRCPTVILIENPEELLAEHGEVRWINDQPHTNVVNTSMKMWLSDVQSNILKPGGHSMVLVTHTKDNHEDSRARGGNAQEERARSVYKMWWKRGESAPTLKNRSNLLRAGETHANQHLNVRPVSPSTIATVSRIIGKDASVLADIPPMVFDHLAEPPRRGSGADDGIFDIDDSAVTEGTYSSRELLDLLKISSYNKANPGRTVVVVLEILDVLGWNVERFGNKWVVTRKEHDAQTTAAQSEATQTTPQQAAAQQAAAQRTGRGAQLSDYLEPDTEGTDTGTDGEAA